MIRFFKNLFYKIRYKNSNQWHNICEIDDTDMKIVIYRLALTNHIGIVIWDKVPGSENEYESRESYFSSGDPKYAKMPGFSMNPECEELDLNEMIEKHE